MYRSENLGRVTFERTDMGSGKFNGDAGGFLASFDFDGPRLG